MAATTKATAASLEVVLKALADPVRLEIVRQMAIDGEVACTHLEKVLRVKKPTISHHIKVLYYADLAEIRREGRFFFYSLRRDMLDQQLPGFERQLALLEPYAPQKKVAAPAEGPGAPPAG